MQSLKTYCITFYILVSCTHTLYSQQTPYLERRVSLQVNNQPVSEVFKSLTLQTSVIFSYTGFNDNQKITKTYHKWPLRKVLDDLFKEVSCSYVLKEKYVIMHCDEKEQGSKASIVSIKRIDQVFLPENPTGTLYTVLKSIPAEPVKSTMGSSVKAYSIVKIGIHATLAVPTGGGPDMNSIGLGFNASYFIAKKIAIGVNASHNSFRLYNVPKYNNFQCLVTQLTVSGEYYLGDQNLRPYIETDFGLYINKVDYSYSYYVLPYFGAFYRNYVTITRSDRENRFGFAPGMGISYRLNHKIEVNTALKYHVILSNYGTIPYWGITTGLVFSL